MIPVLSNQISLDKDFKLTVNDLDNSVFTLLNDAKSTFDNVFGDGDEKDYKELLTNFGKLFGIPVNNIYRYTMGVIRKTNEDFAREMDARIRGKKYSNKTEINKALESGNISKAKSIYKLHNKNADENIPVSTVNEMFRLYSLGYRDISLKQIPSTINYDGNEYDVNMSEFKSIYNKSTNNINKLIANYKYDRLNDDEKSQAISLINNAYYNIAKKQYTGVALSDYEILLASGLDLTQQTIHLAKIKSLNGKQEKVRYINSLRISSKEKYLLLMLAGYTLSEEGTKQVKRLLLTKGISSKQISSML